MLDAVYSERPSVWPGAFVWSRNAEPAGASTRVLPDGCMDLI